MSAEVVISFLVGVVVGWLVLPMLLGMFGAKKA